MALGVEDKRGKDPEKIQINSRKSFKKEIGQRGLEEGEENSNCNSKNQEKAAHHADNLGL